MQIALLDGYIDEPSSLGVPPFISPIVRYMAGAMADSGHDHHYYTIDSYRRSPKVRSSLMKADLLVVVAGATVPGKYIHGTPMSEREALEIGASFEGVRAIAGSMVSIPGTKKCRESRKGQIERTYDMVLRGDPDAQLFDALKDGLCSQPVSRKRTMAQWRDWAILGAGMVKEHPDHPQPLIAEVDVYKGCPRFHSGGCSFCAEILLGAPRFRDKEDVAKEVRALSEAGVTNFRLACSDMMSYKPKGLEEGRIVPSPDEVGSLLRSIKKAAHGIKVLHVDNADPAVIARNVSECELILEHLVENCTPGNILSLGMESADPKVISENNLNSTPDEVLEAIRTINLIGSKRGDNGMPNLLPGLNFLLGLKGETPRTYELNLDFLKKVLSKGCLVRRINIRQVMAHRASFPGVRKRKYFMRFKASVRECIDGPMLRKVLPLGTVLKDIYMEERRGKILFGRQVGTYPILIGVPSTVDIKGPFDAAVVDWGYRSITAVPHPLDINRATINVLMALPGIGKKRAARLVRGRPYGDLDGISRVLEDDELAHSLGPFLSFSKLK